MGDYLRIARVYLRGSTAAVWCFMLLCLLVVSAFGGELAKLTANQGAVMGGVLSRKSYMAMFAYFNACLLGVLLRDNIAHPWATVLPFYRQKHLLVTTLIALLFLGIPMFSMEFVGTSDIAPMSVAVIFLTCLAAGLWTLHHPILGLLAFPFLAFVGVPSSFSPMFAAFLAGTSPVASAALIFMSLLALWAFAWRLLTLNEDMFEYAIARVWGDFLRGRDISRVWGDFLWRQTKALAALPANQQASLQKFDSLKKTFSNLKQVDDLSGYSERSLWRRLRLWRLGTAPTRTFISVAWLILVTLLLILPSVLIQRLAGTENPARDAVVIMSVQVMANPVTLWLPWFIRLHRLGYESLRPRTRQEFVREFGLALLWDTVQCWLGGLVCMGIAAAIWAPELLRLENLVRFISCTGAVQLCVYAMMGIWILRLLNRGIVASLSYACWPLLAMESCIVFVAMNSRISVEVILAIASVLAAASVATIPLAYRRWCRADLG